jgi:hypothetical protein
VNRPLNPPQSETFGLVHGQEYLIANLRKIDPELLAQIMGKEETL